MAYSPDTTEYFNRAHDAIAKSDKTEPLSAGLLNYALSLKQPRALKSIPTPEADLNLPIEQQQINKTRKYGNRLVRFAIGSGYAAHHNHTLLSLDQMSRDVRSAMIKDVLATDSDDNFYEMPVVDQVSDEVVIETVARTKALTYPDEYFKQLRRAYIRTSVGGFPPDAWPRPTFGHNDVTLTQAFGRNSFEDKELPKIVEARQENGSDEITFLKFLKKEKFDPGASNRALAETIAQQLQDPKRNIEQIMQWEVAYALWDQYPDLYKKFQPALHVVWPSSDFYPTFEVKADSIKRMKQESLYNPYEFAHADMMVRAAAILWKQGVPGDILAADIPFDENSSQEWTRNPQKWEMREKLTRVHHVALGHVALFRPKVEKPSQGGHH